MATCAACHAAEALTWRNISGGGSIYSFAVIYDTPIRTLQADVPYVVAVIALDDAPGINMLSHLPGAAPMEVGAGARVRLIFESTNATGQMVPEWVIDADAN